MSSAEGAPSAPSGIAQLVAIYDSAPKLKDGKLDATNLFIRRTADGNITLEDRGLGVWIKRRFPSTRNQYNFAQNLEQLKGLIESALKDVSQEGKTSQLQAKALQEITALYNRLLAENPSEKTKGRFQKHLENNPKASKPGHLTRQHFFKREAHAPDSKAASFNAWLAQKLQPQGEEVVSEQQIEGLTHSIELLAGSSNEASKARQGYQKAQERLQALKPYLEGLNLSSDIQGDIHECAGILEGDAQIQLQEGPLPQSINKALLETFEKLKRIEDAVIVALQENVNQRIRGLEELKTQKGPKTVAVIGKWIEEIQTTLGNVLQGARARPFKETADKLKSTIASHSIEFLQNADAEDQQAVTALEEARAEKLRALNDLKRTDLSRAERVVVDKWVKTLTGLQVSVDTLQKQSPILEKALREYTPGSLPEAVDQMMQEEQAKFQEKISALTFGSNSPIMQPFYSTLAGGALALVRRVGAVFSRKAEQAQAQALREANLSQAEFQSGCTKLCLSARLAKEKNLYLRKFCVEHKIFVGTQEEKQEYREQIDELLEQLKDPVGRTHTNLQKLFKAFQEIEKENTAILASIGKKRDRLSPDDQLRQDRTEQCRTIFGGFAERLDSLESFSKITRLDLVGHYAQARIDLWKTRDRILTSIESNPQEATKEMLVASRTFQEQEQDLFSLLLTTWLAEHSALRSPLQNHFQKYSDEEIAIEFLKLDPVTRLKTLAEIAAASNSPLEDLQKEPELPTIGGPETPAEEAQ